jgi:predicted nucleic acid-binding protein
MIVDTSVWVEFFIGSGSAADRWLGKRIEAELPIVVPEIVLMELLIGTTDEDRAAARRRALAHFGIEPLAPVRDSEDAAAIHRQCRRAGNTVRNLIDCQIAAMAIRLQVEVAHRDRDYAVIAEHCGLQAVALFD